LVAALHNELDFHKKEASQAMSLLTLAIAR
jgi:hypothetical protein